MQTHKKKIQIKMRQNDRPNNSMSKKQQKLKTKIKTLFAPS